MHRSLVLGLSAAFVASLLGGCVIVIGNDDDDLEEGYHMAWDLDDNDNGNSRDRAYEAGNLLGDVRARFNDDNDLRYEPILIGAKDGVVTLSGEVSSARALDRAVAVASQTPGVDSVVLKVVVAVDRSAGA